MTTVESGIAQEWIDLLGEEYVVSDPKELKRAETATFAIAHSVPLILRPKDLAQVQECMRIANRLRIAVYPVSSGKNWGYGSRVPSASGSALLDLSRMNRIVEFNENLAYVTVEPGVTQRQLHEFLRQRKSRLWMDATGSSPDCSLIGNTMERGFGHTPYGDHFAQACGLEVVLPSGECIRTGFSRFGGPSAPLYKWGLGPSLDGLFSQSNFGIVTGMTIWLMPQPKHFEAFFFRCDREEDLSGVIDALRPLRLDGTLRSAVHIGNDYKVLSGLRQYPWEEMKGATPLSQRHMDGFRKDLHFGAWNGSGGLYGTRAQTKEARRLVRRALKGKVSKLQFVDDRKLKLAGRFSGVAKWFTGWDLSRVLELLNPVYGLLKGVPTHAPLCSTYWRKTIAPPADPDPDRDRCGLLWYAPVAPLEGGHALKLAREASETLLQHGYEPMLSLTLVTERAVTCVVSINYDRDVPGEDERAMAAYRDLQRRLMASGYFSYRSGLQSMVEMDGEKVYTKFLQTLKQAIDPQHVLAPGRYQSAARSS